jgi:small nuclear ribonucleoprotein (snRNP)-like protein
MVAEGGRVVLVHKLDATADILYSGRKVGGRLELEPVVPVIFVELRGELEGSDKYSDIPNMPTKPFTRAFWGDVSGYVDLLYRTAGLRFYLRMRSPDYCLVKQGETTGFGLCGENPVIALKGTDVVQGTSKGVDLFHRLILDWVELGMPGLTGFRLVISDPGNGRGSAYRFEGQELLYEYFPLRPRDTRDHESVTDIRPLRAASG